MEKSEIKKFIAREFINYNLSDMQLKIIQDMFSLYINLIKSINPNNTDVEIIQAHADVIKSSIINTINIARVTND